MTTKLMTNTLMTPSAADPRVLCFGEAFVKRIPDRCHEADAAGREQPGGSAANVACGLARLGTPAAFLGRLGDDENGRHLRDLFERRRVSMKLLQWDRERPTRVLEVRPDAGPGSATVESTPDADLGFADEAVRAPTMAEAAMPLLRQAQWLMISSSSLSRASSAVALELLLHRATAKGVSIALDVAWRPESWGLPLDAAPTAEVLRRLRPLVETAHLIRCTCDEAHHIFGHCDPAALHVQLPKRPGVLITDGAGTTLWCLGGRNGILPPVNETPVDRSGAGDAVLAGLLDGLCREPDLLGGVGPGGEAIPDPHRLEQLLRFASTCGALVCGAEGTVAPQPTRAQVRDALDR